MNNYEFFAIVVGKKSQPQGNYLKVWVMQIDLSNYQLFESVLCLLKYTHYLIKGEIDESNYFNTMYG